MLDAAFEALKKFDWGTDLSALDPIEDAVIASHGNANASRDLESRLVVALQGNITRDGKDYVCRKLSVIGSAAAVPVLAGMLGNKDESHMARYALQRISAPAAGRALRDALAQVDGNLKIGVISSLGARRDSQAVAPLSDLVREKDPALARSAALALGAIGNPVSSAVLQATFSAGNGDRQAVIDGLLSCAEALLAGNNTADAMSIYKLLSAGQQQRLVRLAATRGILACAAKLN